jgi:ABC-type transporter Mla maintaining outer membrane lipid asymmetry permease subunit MlaE
MAFAAWLLGASVVVGVTTALQTGYALRAFSAESRVSGLLALAAFRVLAAHVAATATSVAIVVGMRPPSSTAAQRQAPFWLFHVAVPLATPLAACTMILAGTGVGTVAYDLSARTSWESIVEIARVDDLLYGIASACAYALALGAISAIVDPRRLHMGGRLIVRILVAVIATGLVTGLVGGALNAALS